MNARPEMMTILIGMGANANFGRKDCDGTSNAFCRAVMVPRPPGEGGVQQRVEVPLNTFTANMPTTWPHSSGYYNSVTPNRYAALRTLINCGADARWALRKRFYNKFKNGCSACLDFLTFLLRECRAEPCVCVDKRDFYSDDSETLLAAKADHVPSTVWSAGTWSTAPPPPSPDFIPLLLQFTVELSLSNIVV